MAKLPLKKNDYKLADASPRHIVIHHSVEICPGVPIDNATFQTGKFQQKSYIFTKPKLKGYHIVFEKITDEYYPILSQPLFTKCLWPDVDDVYENSIHIGILGDYDFEIPSDRLYDVLSFRVLVPICRGFRIPIENIVLHRDISKKKDLTCPGMMFERIRLIKAFRTHWRKGPTLARKF